MIELIELKEYLTAKFMTPVLLWIEYKNLPKSLMIIFLRHHVHGL